MSSPQGSAALLGALLGALRFVDQRIETNPSTAWAEMRDYLSGQIEHAEGKLFPRNVAQAANQLGLSEEATRKWLHRLYPTAKVEGRFQFTPEVWATLLNHKNDPLRAGGRK